METRVKERRTFVSILEVKQKRTLSSEPIFRFKLSIVERLEDGVSFDRRVVKTNNPTDYFNMREDYLLALLKYQSRLKLFCQERSSLVYLEDKLRVIEALNRKHPHVAKLNQMENAEQAKEPRTERTERKVASMQMRVAPEKPSAVQQLLDLTAEKLNEYTELGEETVEKRIFEGELTRFEATVRKLRLQLMREVYK